MLQISYAVVLLHLQQFCRYLFLKCAFQRKKCKEITEVGYFGG